MEPLRQRTSEAICHPLPQNAPFFLIFPVAFRLGRSGPSSPSSSCRRPRRSVSWCTTSSWRRACCGRRPRSSLGKSRAALKRPAKGERTRGLSRWDSWGLANRWLRSTRHESIQMCHPQDRNIHNSVFGGFLMREAFELGWMTASMFCGAVRPCVHAVESVWAGRVTRLR
jgi:hypothetical protein